MLVTEGKFEVFASCETYKMSFFFRGNLKKCLGFEIPQCGAIFNTGNS